MCSFVIFWYSSRKPISYPESSGFLVSGATPGILWGHRKKFNFFDWLFRNGSIVLPQKSCAFFPGSTPNLRKEHMISVLLITLTLLVGFHVFPSQITFLSPAVNPLVLISLNARGNVMLLKYVKQLGILSINAERTHKLSQVRCSGRVSLRHDNRKQSSKFLSPHD